MRRHMFLTMVVLGLIVALTGSRMQAAAQRATPAVTASNVRAMANDSR